MSIDRKLLEILVCPITKQPVAPLTPARLEKVNALIQQGKIHSTDGVKIDKPLTQGLVTQNGNTIYPVEDNVPVMIEERGIPCEQIADW